MSKYKLVITIPGIESLESAEDVMGRLIVNDPYADTDLVAGQDMDIEIVEENDASNPDTTS